MKAFHCSVCGGVVSYLCGVVSYLCGVVSYLCGELLVW